MVHVINRIHVVSGLVLSFYHLILFLVILVFTSAFVSPVLSLFRVCFPFWLFGRHPTIGMIMIGYYIE